MRTRWLPCLALLALAALPARPALAQDAKAPTVVVRVRSLANFFESARLLASMAGKEQMIKDLEDLLKSRVGPKALDCLDLQRPAGLYARIGKDLSDLQAVFLVPVASEKGFLEMLDSLNYKAEKDKDGLYRVKQDVLPVDLSFRFAHKYAYITPLSPDAIAPAALVEPARLFPAKQSAMLSLTLRLEQIPEAARQLIVEQLGELTKVVDQKMEGEGEAQRALRAALAREVGRQLTAVFRDGTELNAQLDIDRKANELTAEVTVGAKSGSELAGTLAKLGQGKSLFAGLLRDDAALNALVRMELPQELRKALAGVVDEAAKKALAKTADAAKRKQVARLVEALMPTLQGGDVDLGITLRGGAGKQYTLVAGIKLKEAAKLEQVLRELIKDLPAAEQARIKLDFEKTGGAAIHRLDLARGFDDKAKAAFGEHPIYLAFRPDAALVAVGEDGLKALREAATAEATASAPLRFEISLARLAQVMGGEAAKALPKGEDGRLRITVEGGDVLRLRLRMGLSLLRLFGQAAEAPPKKEER
jgi:hypothetical protein